MHRATVCRQTRDLYTRSSTQRATVKVLRATRARASIDPVISHRCAITTPAERLRRTTQRRTITRRADRRVRGHRRRRIAILHRVPYATRLPPQLDMNRAAICRQTRDLYTRSSTQRATIKVLRTTRARASIDPVISHRCAITTPTERLRRTTQRRTITRRADRGVRGRANSSKTIVSMAPVPPQVFPVEPCVNGATIVGEAIYLSALHRTL